MSNFAPVNGWDTRNWFGAESTFGTAPTPTAAMAREMISMNLGAAEVGQVRAKKDRNAGRGMTNAFVEGRVGPMPFSGQTTVKSRAAVDTVPQEDVFYAAAGLKKTVTGGVNVVYTLDSTPVELAEFSSMACYQVKGPDLASYEAEWMRGMVNKSLKWSGGDKEVLLDFAGSGIGKATLGYISSVTLDNVQTTYAGITVEEAYRINNAKNTFGHVYLKVESEVLDVTNVAIGTHTLSFARAALGTSAVAHTAKPLYPYQPLLTGYAGSPIPEPNCVVAIDGVTLRALSWELNLKQTGIDLLPGETGSAHLQGVKTSRYDMEGTAKLVCHGDDVAMLGKATQRGVVAWEFNQGTGAGGIIDIAGSFAEIVPFAVPDTAGGESIIDVKLRIRDNSTGNNSLTITLT